MGNGWVGPYTPVYVQPSGGRERWWIRKRQKTSCHGKAESLRMTGKTLRKFNIYRPPEKSPGHKNGTDRVPSTIFSVTRFVHFLRLCMLELPPRPSNQDYFIFGKSQPKKTLKTLVTVAPGTGKKTPFSVLNRHVFLRPAGWKAVLRWCWRLPAARWGMSDGAMERC